MRFDHIAHVAVGACLVFTLASLGYGPRLANAGRMRNENGERR